MIGIGSGGRIDCPDAISIFVGMRGSPPSPPPPLCASLAVPAPAERVPGPRGAQGERDLRELWDVSDWFLGVPSDT